MKKLATLLMLIVALLVGGMTIEAKTTKKNSKARTSQTSSKSSFNFKQIVNLYDKLDYMSSLNTIHDNITKEMAKYGFKPGREYESKYLMESPDESTWYEDAMHYTYSKGDTTIDFAILYYKEKNHHKLLKEISMTFPSTAALNSFISASKSSLGKSFYKLENNLYQYLNWAIAIDGKKLTMTWYDEM